MHAMCSVQCSVVKLDGALSANLPLFTADGWKSRTLADICKCCFSLLWPGISIVNVKLRYEILLNKWKLNSRRSGQHGYWLPPLRIEWNGRGPAAGSDTAIKLNCAAQHCSTLRNTDKHFHLTSVQCLYHCQHYLTSVLAYCVSKC